jgi:hypothetical protein
MRTALGGSGLSFFDFPGSPSALPPFASNAPSLQVRTHNLNEFVGRKGLLGI